MIKVLMLDLEGTLAEGQSLFANVPAALKALMSFETAGGRPLGLSLVCDADEPAAPARGRDDEDIFNRFISRLEQLGLREFFEPTQRRVTLSVHARARLPDPDLFRTAIQRLKMKAGLGECLFISEKTEYVLACREQLKMQALRFERAGGGDFDDWLDAPLLAARIIAPESPVNLRLALNLRLETTHALELVTITSRSSDGRVICGHGRRWLPLPDLKQKGRRKIHVQMPVEVELELDAEGLLQSVKSSQPDTEELMETAAFVESLEANQQIARGPESPSMNATHRLVEEQGKWRLKRIRFNAA
ncbi:MAG TPA: hypothetical protein VF723_04365 [Pyrinomonadaceae bacterium]|jgi:hypothetical protein